MNKDTLLYILFQLIHWSDWIVAGVYVWFIWHVFVMAGGNYDTLLTMGDLSKWTMANLYLAIFTPSLIGYAIFFPWSFFKKRREIYFSEMTQPYGWVYIPFMLLSAKYNYFYYMSVIDPVISTLGFIGVLFFFFSILASFLGGFWGFKVGWFWYRKFGLEPMTWEEAMRRYGED